MQIRTVTREMVTEHWKQSRVQGKDIGEVLDRAGVLLTPERLATVRAICLEQIARLLEETPTSHYTQGRGVTLNDFQAILAQSIRYAAATEREGISR